jgi:hypothetical protein
MERVRIILSALWVARMLSSLQGDTMRLSDPVVLKELVAGTTGVPITDAMLLGFSVILAVPILMSFLSLTLKYPIVRWANLIVGTFFVLFELYFMISFYLQDAAYEIFWGIAYLSFALLVVWYAWKWPREEGVEVTT